MQLLDFNFTSYIPTTLLGLLGLLFAYLYGFYRNRDNNKLQQIKSIRSSERSKVIEMMLNDLGVSIDTTSLNSKQKFDLVIKLLNAKTRKYLIISITSILLSLIVAFLIWSHNQIPTTSPNLKDSSITEKNNTDTIKKNTIHDTIFKNNDSKMISPEESVSKSTDRPARKTTSVIQQKTESTIPKKFTLHLFSNDILTTKVLWDGESIGSLDFTATNHDIVNVTKGNHTIEFRFWSLGQERDLNFNGDKLGMERDIYVDGDATYEVYLVEEKNKPSDGLLYEYRFFPRLRKK